MCMSCSALFALKRAIEEARKEVGIDNFFPLSKFRFMIVNSYKV